MHQARVFSLSLAIDREKLAAFERHCDLNDRGIGWKGLERATYLVRESPIAGPMELSCTWNFSPTSLNPAQKIEELLETWQNDFAVIHRAHADVPLRAWTVIHSYFGGARQDCRSPLMDAVVAKAFVREPEGFDQIRKRNCDSDLSPMGLPPITLSPQDGHQLMTLLLTAGAKRGVEIGTLGGYSAAWICQAIGESGSLVTIEKDAKRARGARENLARLGFSDRVECRTGDARQVLNNLVDAGPWDFVFIDADKASYGFYVAWAMQNVKSGGLIFSDNAYLWGGMLAYPGDSPDETQSPSAGSRLHGFDTKSYEGMREAWLLLSESNDFDTWMLPSPEGLLVARKKT